jgi:hypothetical protein
MFPGRSFNGFRVGKGQWLGAHTKALIEASLAVDLIVGSLKARYQGRSEGGTTTIAVEALLVPD